MEKWATYVLDELICTLFERGEDAKKSHLKEKEMDASSAATSYQSGVVLTYWMVLDHLSHQIEIFGLADQIDSMAELDSDELLRKWSV